MTALAVKDSVIDRRIQNTHKLCAELIAEHKGLPWWRRWLKESALRMRIFEEWENTNRVIDYMMLSKRMH